MQIYFKALLLACTLSASTAVEINTEKGGKIIPDPIKEPLAESNSGAATLEQLTQGVKQLAENLEQLAEKENEKDEQHDQAISDILTKLATLEEKIDTVDNQIDLLAGHYGWGV